MHATLQNGIFNAGTTSRANVGEFMANLVTEPATWAEWKDTYPHVLDAVSVEAEPAEEKQGS